MREEDRPLTSSRYSPEQVGFGMRQAEKSTAVSEVCLKMDIGDQTFYRWRAEYGGLWVD